MNTRAPAIFALLMFAATAGFALEEGRFFRYPSVHQDKIVFTYEGDLWLVGAEGGTAARLTTFPGTESFAKFSPDGRQIAFSASYDGAPAAYVMPAEGGAPVRLTYVPGSVQVVGWSPDGVKVVFRSMFENFIGRDPNLYYAPVKGGAPERFPLERGTLVSFSADGRSFLYCRKGDEEYYWKRYKGGRYPDIWLYDAGAKTYTPVTDYVGKNAYPMWIGDTMYFTSDRGNGITNIFAQKIGTKEARPVTSYSDFDVMWPSTDGRTIAYIQDGHINLLDVGSGRSKKITVLVPSDRWALRDRVINPREYIHHVDPANNGRSVILEARGDVFSVPVGRGEAAVNLSHTAGTREMYPAVSPDGKWVAFFSDRTGDYQLYLQKTEGGDWTPLTTDLDRTVYHLAWSPDGRKILFGNKDFSIFFIDVATKKLVKVDTSNQMKNDEFYWEVSDYAWSPDSNWIAYSLVQFNRNSQVFIYDTLTGRRHAVTDDFYDNLYPRFDAGGDYLYFVSSRNFGVRMDFYEDNHVIDEPQQVMAVQLRAGEKPPFGGEPVPEKQEEKAEPRPFRIDTEGLARRVFPLPVQAGNFFHLQAGKGKVLWASVDRFSEEEYEEIFKPGGRAKWTLNIFDLGSRKAVALTDKVGAFALSADGERLISRVGDAIHLNTVDKAYQSKGLGDALDLSTLVYKVELQKEWNQIFNDCWRWYRDFFYSPIFNGRDWRALGEKFRGFIPYLSSREELNWAMSQMVGELCVSHTYIGGGDYGPGETPRSAVSTGLLGADLVPDASGIYRLAKIYGPTDINRNLAGPLVRPDIAVKEGDFLLAINGTPLRAGDDYFRLLQVGRGQKVRVTVNSRPMMEGAKTYDVEPVGSDQQLRYFRWIQDNIRKIAEATGGRVGYMHINAMGSGGIGEFDKYWRAFRYKDGIIIDVRRNSGGWTEYFLIDKLERQVTALNVLRDMVPFRYPGSAGAGNYVVISNEYNGSDGEAFVEHFKARKLGTVVGVPSWGGLVGILNGQATIDNGSIQQSNNAFYNRDGQWLVENHGADPDIVVDNDPGSVMAGRDLQLEKAIEVMLEKITTTPWSFPPLPAYPRR